MTKATDMFLLVGAAVTMCALCFICEARRTVASAGPHVQQSLARMRRYPPAGVAVFRGGLKKRSGTTRAPTRCRTACIVYSNSRRVPDFSWPRSTLASAISFFSTSDHAVDVALPTWRPSDSPA